MQRTLAVDVGTEGFYPVVTTDSGANMKKAIQSIDGWVWVKCALHCLHNIVLAGLRGWLPHRVLAEEEWQKVDFREVAEVDGEPKLGGE